MGMYATVGEAEVKLSGLLAQAAMEAMPGKYEEAMQDAVLSLSKADVEAVMFKLASIIDNKPLINNYSINMRDVDTQWFALHKLSSLMDWLSTAGPDEDLVFI